MAIKFLNTVQVDTDVLYVDASSNNVGIGTTSPSTKLHVSGGDIRIDDTEQLQFGAGGVRINNDAAGRMYQRAPLGFYWETNGGYRMVLNSSGNVGIGTTSPSSRLDVLTSSSGPVAKLKNTSSTGGSGLDVYGGTGSGSNILTLYDKDSNQRLEVTGEGNVGIGTTSPDSKLHVYANNVDAPTIVTIENGDVGVVAGQDLSKIEFLTNDASAPGAGIAASIRTVCQNAGNIFDLAFNTQNGSTRTERMRLTGAGNLGIGDTTPSYKLDVTGEGRFTGDLRCLSLIQTSQRDQKENINDINKSKAKAIPFKEYTYKSSIDGSSKKRYGVIAEDIESDYPELVHTGADGVKGINYIDLLVKRVAELEKELEDISLTPGPKGANGSNGADGVDGLAGADGADGNSHLSNITSIAFNSKANRLQINIGKTVYNFAPSK